MLETQLRSIPSSGLLVYCWFAIRQGPHLRVCTQTCSSPVEKQTKTAYAPPRQAIAFPAGIYLHAMQVQNRALQGGLVFTRWLWFLGPVHGFGMIWTASFLLAVLRITTATLVSTWYILSQLQ